MISKMFYKMQSLLDSERKTVIPLYFCTTTRITSISKTFAKLRIAGCITRGIYDFDNEGNEIDISIDDIKDNELYTIVQKKEIIEKCLQKVENNDNEIEKCLQKVENNDSLFRLTMVYKLDQGTYITDGFDIFRHNNGYDHNIYISPTKGMTTYNYVNPKPYVDFLMIPEIANLPWQFEGYFKYKIYRFPRWFKNQHKKKYNDTLRHGGVTFMFGN